MCGDFGNLLLKLFCLHSIPVSDNECRDNSPKSPKPSVISQVKRLVSVDLAAGTD